MFSSKLYLQTTNNIYDQHMWQWCEHCSTEADIRKQKHALSPLGTTPVSRISQIRPSGMMLIVLGSRRFRPEFVFWDMSDPRQDTDMLDYIRISGFLLVSLSEKLLRNAWRVLEIFRIFLYFQEILWFLIFIFIGGKPKQKFDLMYTRNR